MSGARIGAAIFVFAVAIVMALLLQTPSRSGSKSRSGSDGFATPDPAILEAKRAAAAGQAPATTPGPRVELSEAKRKEILTQATRALARASEEVGGAAAGAASNPFGAGAVPDPDRVKKQELKRKAKLKNLEDLYLREVAQQNGIGEAQLLEIVAEGRAHP